MLEDCRWLLYASRLYGCHPHTIRERSAATATRFLMLYSIVTCAAYCGAAYHASSVAPCVSEGAMIVGCALQRVERYTRGLFMILTTLLSCLCHREFERAVASARKFDQLTARRHRDVRVNRRVQWLAMLGVHAAWLVFGLYTRNAMKGRVAWLTVTIQTITRCAFSTQVAKFCFLYDALRRRFRLVNRLCRGGSPPTRQRPVPVVPINNKRGWKHHRVQRVTVGANAGASAGLYAEGLTILHLQQLHRCLTDATKYLSSYYSPQLLSWLACLLMDILMYIFFTLYTVNDVKIVIVQCTILSYLSVQVIAVSRVCHLTCDQANALARIVLSVGTCAFRRDEFSTEAIELGVYLRTQPLRIRVFGLFNMDNRLPFSTSPTVYSCIETH